METYFETVFITKKPITQHDLDNLKFYLRKITTNDVYIDNEGEKELAYELQGHKTGYYYILHYKIDESITNISPLEEYLKACTNVLKYLTVKQESGKMYMAAVQNKEKCEDRGYPEDMHPTYDLFHTFLADHPEEAKKKVNALDVLFGLDNYHKKGDD